VRSRVPREGNHNQWFRPSYSVSIMEFRDGRVARETQYFSEPFEPKPSRANLVERMG
jgi:hypothetical protein